MTKECPNCASKQVTKRGLSEGRQRYVCKSCKKTFSEHKHSQDKKDFALFLYIHSNGIRQISKILKVAPSLVLFWIKKAHEKLKELVKRRLENKRKLDIIELDEIYTYVKKNFRGCSYGLLIAEEKSVLLRLTSQARQIKR